VAWRKTEVVIAELVVGEVLAAELVVDLKNFA
jgi:hypothetical protein